MRRWILALSILVGGIGGPAAADEIRVIYDQRPEADIPREARGAGTTPDGDAKGGPGSNITFGIVTDLRDYGPLRNVMPPDVHAVTVRHFDRPHPLAPGTPGLPGSPPEVVVRLRLVAAPRALRDEDPWHSLNNP